MTSDVRRLGSDALLSIFAFLFSVVIGLYVYRLLWGSLTSNEFSSWFLIFEISQFLLLFDFGFTHKFILECKDVNALGFKTKLNGLRFILLLAAVVASMALLSVVVIYGRNAERLQSSYIFLSLSIIFTLLSYAETAALRVGFRNKSISIITIISQAIFISILFFLSDNMPFAIGVAVFSRSAFVYLSQIYVLGQGYEPKWVKGSYFGGGAVAINFSYFILFMLDVAIFNMTVLDASDIAILLVVKKYFDMLRALWDNVLPNMYARFARGGGGGVYIILTVFCFLSYIIAAFMAGWIIPVWITGFAAGYSVYSAFCLSFFGVTLFRVVSLKMFYKEKLNWKFMVGIVVAIKSVFTIILIFGQAKVNAAYLAQGVLLITTMITIDIKQSKGRN